MDTIYYRARVMSGTRSQIESSTADKTGQLVYVINENGMIYYDRFNTEHMIVTGNSSGNITSRINNMRLYGTMQLKYGVAINNISTDGTFVGNSDLALATEKATKTYIASVLSGNVDGSGTTHYIPKWSDSDTITDSLLYELSGQVAIGTETPEARFHISQATTAPDLLIANTGNNDVRVILRSGRTAAGTHNQIQFRGWNDAGTPADIMYSRIYNQLIDNSEGIESSRLFIQNAMVTGGSSVLATFLEAREDGALRLGRLDEIVVSGAAVVGINRTSSDTDVALDINGRLKIENYAYTSQLPGQTDMVLGYNCYSTTTDTDLQTGPQAAITLDPQAIIMGPEEGIRFITTASHPGPSTDFSIGANEKMRLTPTGELGLGTTIPSFNSTMHMRGDAGLLIDTTAASDAGLILRRYDTTITTGEVLSSVIFAGADPDNAALRKGAEIRGVALGSWVTNSYPSELQFWTNNYAASPVQVGVIDETGNLGMGVTNPVARIHAEDSDTNDMQYIGVFDALGAGNAVGAGIQIRTIGNNAVLRAYSDNHATLANWVDVGSTASNAKLGILSGGTRVAAFSSTGQLALGTDNASDDMLRIVYSPVLDTGANGIAVTFESTVTSSGTYYNKGMEISSTTNITGSQTNSGYLIGYHASTAHNSLGTLDSLSGMWLQYGTSTGAGVATNVRGIQLSPRAQAGTITDRYDILIDAPVVGGTVTNDWCIYSSHNAPSYLVGRLGLGTDDPDNALHISTSDAALAKFETTNIGGVALIFVNSTDTGYFVCDDSKIGIGFTQSINSSNLTILSTGHVGIGNVSPEAPLHVQQVSGDPDMIVENIGVDRVQFQLKSNAAVSSTAATIELMGRNAASADIVYGSMYAYIVDKTTGAEDGRVFLRNMQAGTLTNFIEAREDGELRLANHKVTIDASGNLGVNTPVPLTPLHISTATNFVARFQSSTDQATIMLVDNDTTGYYTVKDSMISLGLNNGLSVSNVTVNASGHIGIGIIAPEAPLHVQQATGAPDCIIENTGTDNVQLQLKGNVGINTTAASLDMISRNSLSADITYGSIYTYVVSNTATSETSRVYMRNYQAAGSTVFFQAREDGEIRLGGSAVYVDSNNKYLGVGIVPTAPLHVSSADNTLVKFISTDDTATMQITDDSTTGYYTSKDNTISIGLQDGLHANNVNIYTSGGKVGIGTIAPTAPIHIVQATGDPDFIIENTGSDDAQILMKSALTTGVIGLIQINGVNSSTASVPYGTIYTSILDNAATVTGRSSITFRTIEASLPKLSMVVAGNTTTISDILKITPIAAAPTGTEGSLYANSTDNKIYYHNGTSWGALN